MSDDDRYLFYEFKDIYADGFARGYNQGFLDGIDKAIELYGDEKLMEILKGTEIKNET